MIELPNMPVSIDKLPRDERGYPVPWFVAWVDGKPEFRCADGEKMREVLRDMYSHCWVCGEPFIDAIFSFVLGPMCIMNRISAEPPSHPECAEFSVKACPFLTKPKAVRREANLPQGSCAGVMIDRNPGVSAVWTTSYYDVVRVHNGNLWNMTRDPAELTFWAEGREATFAEIRESIDSGLPILEKMADCDDARVALAKCVERGWKLIHDTLNACAVNSD